MTAIFEACWYISRRKHDFASLSVQFWGWVYSLILGSLHTSKNCSTCLVDSHWFDPDACMQCLVWENIHHRKGYRSLFITGAMNQHESFLPTIMNSQKWELWDLKEPSATYRVTSWYFAGDRSDCCWLLPLQREVQIDPPKKGRRIVFQSHLNLIAVEGFP